MNNIPRIESYRKGKRKREMVNLLSNIESYLNRFNQLVDGLDVFLSEWEDSGVIDEMTKNMSFQEKRRIQGVFESVEFKVRKAKNRLILPAHCRNRPPLG